MNSIMALSRYKLGELIELRDERNSYGIKQFFGININKEFMPTAADTNGLDESNYKVVRKNRFVFSGMQTGRDKCIRISMYQKDFPIIVSPAYTTFEVTKTDIVLPIYFFLIFLSREKDRLGWFYSDGSIRSNLDWDRFCDIDIELPDLATQQKYVDIYKAMVANQQSYERGLEDLKLVCDAYIEDLRRKIPSEKIGKYITECNERNESLKILDVKGVESSGNFVETKANTDGLDFSNYKIVDVNQFGYNPSRINLGSIALKTDEKCIVSPMYIVFKIDNPNKLLSEYLMLWLSRSEFRRSTQFYTSGSVRDTFGFSEMQKVAIPIPSIEIQKSIANIYNVYIKRKQINEQLKTQIKDICPILIRGSLKEGNERR